MFLPKRCLFWLVVAWILAFSWVSVSTLHATAAPLGTAPSRPALPAGDKISAVYAGGVFLDLNRNGIWELSEQGAAGIDVTVETMDGCVVQQTESDEEGYYIFTDLPLAELRIRVQPPPGYLITAMGTYTIATHLVSGPVLRSTGVARGVSVYLPLLRG